MYLPSRQQRHGFTLVEMLVVITIMLIIAAISYAAVRSYGERQQFEQLTQEVRLQYEAAQQNAQSSVAAAPHGVYVSGTTIEQFQGSTVVVGHSSNTIVSIPSYVDVNYEFSDGGQSVVFARLTGRPSATGTVQLFNSRVISTSTVSITESGLVE